MRTVLFATATALTLLALAGCSAAQPAAPPTPEPSTSEIADAGLTGGVQTAPGQPGQPYVVTYLHGVATVAWKQPTEGGRPDRCNLWYQPVAPNVLPDDQKWQTIATAVGDPTKEEISVDVPVTDPGRYAFAVACQNNAGYGPLAVQDWAELQ